MTNAPDNDEVVETTSAKLRTALMAAAQVAQRIARAREQDVREAAAASTQEATELQTRLEAERQVAAALTAPTARDDWWDTATVEDVTSAYEVAHAWEDIDHTLRRDAMRIRNEVSARYGITPDDLTHSGSLNREADAQRAEARQDVGAAVAMSADSAADLTDGGHADSDYQSAVQGREAALWDSAERREQMASDLQGVASAEEIDVRMLVDTGNAKPAREAVNPRVAGSGSSPEPVKAPKVAQRPTQRPSR
ncbi:hypothetical protein [Aeromicrobium sp.]|uniref:hypothetical protein n=1 Tax=Aeromicrobium sp. TaxID=1871063 RepID=UPI0019C3275C|nr:hypothetical protein [Aeromicrobium sp.]MBC7632973.1 hypothetical protein [Aeromicrobium sp.]